MAIKFNQQYKWAHNGFDVKTYEKGDVYDGNDQDLVKHALQTKIASKVESEKT